MTTYLRAPTSLGDMQAAGHTFQDDDRYATLPRGSGHRRKRPVVSASQRTYTVSWATDSIGAAAGRAWYRHTLRNGSRTWIAAVQTEDMDAPQYFEALFLTPPTFDPRAVRGGNRLWFITGDIVCLGDPSATPPDTLPLRAAYALTLDASAAAIGSARLRAHYGLALEQYAAQFLDIGGALLLVDSTHFLRIR